MPVSRLLVRPHAAPHGLASADRIGLSIVEDEAFRSTAGAGGAIGLGGEAPAGTHRAPLAGPTATPPAGSAPAAPPAPIATVIGPLGPVRAARWNVQLPASGGVASPAASGDADDALAESAASPSLR